MKLSFYPTLSHAFNLMLADNVASAMISKRIKEKVYGESLEPVGVFDRAEEELSHLSQEGLELLCCGDFDDEDRPKVSIDVEDVLLALFEMIS